MVVAYRKATIALADEVVYVEHGRVLDRGTHDELLARCTGYRRLLTAYEREEELRRAVEAEESADTEAPRRRAPERSAAGRGEPSATAAASSR